MEQMRHVTVREPQTEAERQEVKECVPLHVLHDRDLVDLCLFQMDRAET